MAFLWPKRVSQKDEDAYRAQSRYNQATSNAILENPQASSTTEIFRGVSELARAVAAVADLESGYTGNHLDPQRNALRAQFVQVQNSVRTLLATESDPTDPFEEERVRICALQKLIDRHASCIGLMGALHTDELDDCHKALAAWLRTSQLAIV